MEDNLGYFVISPANTATAKSLYRFRTKYPKYCGIRMGMHPNVTTIKNNPMSRAYVLSLMKKSDNTVVFYTKGMLHLNDFKNEEDHLAAAALTEGKLRFKDLISRNKEYVKEDDAITEKWSKKFPSIYKKK